MCDKIYTIEEIKQVLEEILKNEPVKQVILFGSYAKEEADNNSDIDLIIDTQQKLKGFALLKLICNIQERLQKEVDGFEKSSVIENSKIYEEIEKTGVVVYEK
ncbi:MAG: nucleotidyltransferase domain-containing protein [Clostridia bacterium]|nr:nucleotidyltransferase domain-containing protein [Clostridia bacterium]